LVWLDSIVTAWVEKIDYVIARSILTHASKKQIIKMLDSFIKTKSEHGIFLASYLKGDTSSDYKGNEWVGFSNKSHSRGTVQHNFEWIKKECRTRNLDVKEIKDEILNYQIWLRIK